MQTEVSINDDTAKNFMALYKSVYYYYYYYDSYECHNALQILHFVRNEQTGDPEDDDDLERVDHGYGGPQLCLSVVHVARLVVQPSRHACVLVMNQRPSVVVSSVSERELSELAVTVTVTVSRAFNVLCLLSNAVTASSTRTSILSALEASVRSVLLLSRFASFQSEGSSVVVHAVVVVDQVEHDVVTDLAAGAERR